MSELISVIVPVYNTGKYLIDCVNSILVQDYKNIEILLIDDGSTDGCSAMLCDQLANAHKKVKVIHQENKGLSGARNCGVEQAKGEFISFIDSDDVIEHNMLSTLYSMAKHNNVNVVKCGMVIENNKDVVYPDNIVGDKILPQKEFLHYFFLGNNHSACTSLYNKSVFNECIFPLNETNEDYLFNFNVALIEKNIFVTDRKFYHYVKREGSITTINTNLRNLHWLNHVKYVKETMDKCDEFKDLSEEVDYQYLFCNIVLCNKAVLSMADGQKGEALIVYDTAAKELKKSKKSLRTNKFLSRRNRMIGLVISYVPALYKYIMPVLLKLKGR